MRIFITLANVSTDHKLPRSVTLANPSVDNLLCSIEYVSKFVNKDSLTWWYVLKTSWKHLCKTSWRCLEDVFARRLQNDLKAPWRRMAKMNVWFWSRPLQDVLKKFLKTYDYSEYIRLDQDVLKMFSSRQMFAEYSLHYLLVHFPSFMSGYK